MAGESDGEKPKATVEEAGSKGGAARAANLTPAERTNAARLAAEARWKQSVPRATHAGELRIGENTLQCAVLENGTRVLTQEGFYMAIGRSGRPAAGRGSQVEKVAPFLDLNNLKPFVTMELADSTKPVIFQAPSGSRAYGYRAELLPQVCEVYLRARDAGALLKSQERFAVACDILMRGLAHTGIIALVDEATGFQDTRAKDALAKILEQFVAKELQNYLKLFPVAFYKGLCRLRKIPFSPDMQLPRYFGHLTNNIVYARLAPAVLDELRRKNPTVEGRRKTKHYNWLTPHIGSPKLSQHLGSVVTLMELAGDDYEQFMKMLDKIHPVYQSMPLFDHLLED